MKHSNFSVKATQLTLIQPNLIQIQSSSWNNSTQHLPKLSFKATTQPAAFMQLCNRSSALGRAFVVPWWIFWRLEIFWCTSAPSGNVSSGVILHKSSFLTPLQVYSRNQLLKQESIHPGWASWRGLGGWRRGHDEDEAVWMVAGAWLKMMECYCRVTGAFVDL